LYAVKSEQLRSVLDTLTELFEQNDLTPIKKFG
jgi:hypothetical protein